MLDMLIRERLVLIMGVLGLVTPKVWRDEPLLRILAERKVRQILSLRHPCPDRAISSFIRTRCFWEGYGSFIAYYYGETYHNLRYNQRVKANSGRSLRVSDFGGIKGVHVWEKQLSPFLFIWGAKQRVLNMFRSLRKSVNKNMPVPLPHAINNR